jgi:hypothetical protein
MKFRQPCRILFWFGHPRVTGYSLNYNVKTIKNLFNLRKIAQSINIYIPNIEITWAMTANVLTS